MKDRIKEIEDFLDEDLRGFCEDELAEAVEEIIKEMYVKHLSGIETFPELDKSEE